MAAAPPAGSRQPAARAGTTPEGAAQAALRTAHGMRPSGASAGRSQEPRCGHELAAPSRLAAWRRRRSSPPRGLAGPVAPALRRLEAPSQPAARRRRRSSAAGRTISGAGCGAARAGRPRGFPGAAPGGCGGDRRVGGYVVCFHDDHAGAAKARPCGGEWYRASGALPCDPTDLIFKVGMQVLILKSAYLIFAGNWEWSGNEQICR